MHSHYTIYILFVMLCLGRNIIIFKKDGTSYRAIRTKSSFYECGYCYEDINMRGHKAEEVVAWKDERK